MLNAIDWARISPRGGAILRRVAAPLAAGYSLREVARDLRISQRLTSGLVDELRDELERLDEQPVSET